jgi:ABC-type branched-subunit amino acid transport system ATPase component
MRMIEVKNISVSYGAIPALADVSMVLEKGKIVVLLGPNGAGKSTFIKSLIGLKAINGNLSSQARIDRLPVHEITSRISLCLRETALANMRSSGIFISGATDVQKEKSQRYRTIADLFPG